MTDSDGITRWYTADPRGVFPLEPQAFHVPSTLRQVIRQGKFEVRINTAFRQVMMECGRKRDGGTWISEELVDAYLRLHEMGFAHSVEAWREGELAGGLYGVAINSAYFGESMFFRQRDASKVALVALVERLRARGFKLLDTQATTPHLKQFGAIEVPAARYMEMLEEALGCKAVFG